MGFIIQQSGTDAKLPHTPMAEGPLVLLAEPDAVVGLDLADALQAAGYRVAGPMRNGAEALVWLEHATPDYAVIDVQLADGFALELGRALHSLGTPFLVHTATPHGESIVADFWSVPCLGKPCWPAELVASLAALSKDEKGESR